MDTIVIICICAAFLGLVGLLGYTSLLSYKERRELNNRLMCKTIDEYIKLSEKTADKVEKESDSSVDAYVSMSERLVRQFEERGVSR